MWEMRDVRGVKRSRRLAAVKLNARLAISARSLARSLGAKMQARKPTLTPLVAPGSPGSPDLAAAQRVSDFIGTEHYGFTFTVGACAPQLSPSPDARVAAAAALSDGALGTTNVIGVRVGYTCPVALI